MRIVSVPASQSAEDDDKERSKERKAMMAELTAKAVRDTHARAAHAHASALRRRPSVTQCVSRVRGELVIAHAAAARAHPRCRRLTRRR